MRVFALILICLTVVSGCARLNGSEKDKPGETPENGFSTEYVLSGSYSADWTPALETETAIGYLGARAEQMTISRSPSVFRLRAAEADSAAERAMWFPQIRPVATIRPGWTGSVVGISVTQLIYDFAQTRNRREQAEIARVVTELEFWAERNDDVLDALNSYVDAVEANEIILARNALERQLAELAQGEADRIAAGVVAQSGSLVLDVSRQENRREIIEANAALTEARAELFKYSGAELDDPAALRFAALEGACLQPEPRDYSPELLQAKIAVELAEKTEVEARRALYPRLLGEATASRTIGVTEGIDRQITLEGAPVIGGGAHLRIKAAKQRIMAAEREYTNTRIDMTRDMNRLEADQRLLAAQRAEYAELIRANERSLQLFRDRFQSGTSTTSEAVRLEVERTANRVEIIRTRAETVRKCLAAARVVGALSAPRPGTL